MEKKGKPAVYQYATQKRKNALIKEYQVHLLRDIVKLRELSSRGKEMLMFCQIIPHVGRLLLCEHST